MKKIKSQIAVFEMILAVSILISFVIYFGVYLSNEEIGIHKIQIESALNSIYYNEEFRVNFMDEDLL